jgi:hypothetical protein
MLMIVKMSSFSSSVESRLAFAAATRITKPSQIFNILLAP